MTVFIILILAQISFILWLLRCKFQHWQRKGVHTAQNNALVGSWFQLKTMNHLGIMQELYDRFKETTQVAGFFIYTQPVAVILDLDLVKSVLIKDFNKFSDRMIYKNDKDILSANLFALESAKWRPLRNKMSSVFTSAKIKHTFSTMKTVASRLMEVCDKYLESQQIVNISDLSSRYTTDSIANSILGLECNSLEDPLTEYRQILSAILGRTNFNVKWQLFMQTYVKVLQFIGINVKMFPKFIEDFFLKVLIKNVKERERLGIRRNDLVDLLIDLRNAKDEEGKSGLTYNEIASQLFIFLGAGYETSANTIAYALYELSCHPEIQQQARQQIRAKLGEHNNELTFDIIMELPSLNHIISETLRLYPILVYLERTVTKDYLIPETNITLDKGTTVFIPVRSIHHDPEIYDRPDEFRPERFHPSEVAKRHPQSFLGFGDGPRNCIGLRLGRAQVFVALATLLSNYKFSVCEGTDYKSEFSKHTFSLKTAKDIWLKVERTEDM